MKLSVIIIICDTDYTHLPELLHQVSEHVFIEHEIIVIDNRMRYKNEKLCIEPTYVFGYNAYQFAARSKALEYANGEYVWFIDGDDNIVGDIKEEYTEDIIAFSFNTKPQGDIHLVECVRSGKLFTSEQSVGIAVVLWNKLIKRKLFTEIYSDKLKITTNEDTYSYLLSFVHKVPKSDRVKALRIILAESSFNEVKGSLSVLNEKKYTKDEQKALYSVLIELYGKENVIDAFSRKYTVTYANGTTKTIILNNSCKDLF